MDGCELWTDSHVAPQMYSYIELDSVLIIFHYNVHHDQKNI